MIPLASETIQGLTYDSIMPIGLDDIFSDYFFGRSERLVQQNKVLAFNVAVLGWIPNILYGRVSLWEAITDRGAGSNPWSPPAVANKPK